jgi:4-amino-4-deoxy-L-arabinose transferase-like glycosyltransferase
MLSDGEALPDEDADADTGAGADASTTGLRRRLQFWRSPPDQPGWARPALLVIAALAGLSYCWGMNSQQLEPFYGAAARSMSQSWHNFIFGAFDPWGTVSVDKLPGALWFQALSIRAFGFHIWAVVLPQAIEGTLTILVLYRAVRLVAGPGAGLVAAVIMATSPIVLLLDRGNISDTLLILLLVGAADAATRAYLGGRLAPLLWAGLFVGLAFQTKMLQAWLVLPGLYLAYLVAAPVRSLLRRAGHVLLSIVVVGIVSLSWMTAVSAVPATERPYVDGSCHDSLYSQVFVYNGFGRLAHSPLSSDGCYKPPGYLVTLSKISVESGLSTGGIGPSWHRLLGGVFGHDDAWLLVPTVVSGVGLLLMRRRRARTDPVRAAVILWGVWLLVHVAFFSAGRYINSYYVAALLPSMGALCAMGAAAAWRARARARVRLVLALTTVATVATSVALVPGYAGVKGWILATTVAIGLLAVLVLVGSLRAGHASTWNITVGPALAAMAMLAGTVWASGVVFPEGLGPFDAPYEPAHVDQITHYYVSIYGRQAAELNQFAGYVPKSQAVDVIESSYLAAPDIMETGREFLPVGGFTGSAPTPSLTSFIRDVREGRIDRATVVAPTLTRSPDLIWVRSHCRQTDSYPFEGLPGTKVSIFQCRPSDASG